jgi:hypothetical protein
MDLKESFDRMEAEAKQGRINGLRELAFIAHESALRLEEWATKYPLFTSFVAEDYASWPILGCCKKSKLLSKIELLRSIKLNEGRPNITPDPKVGVAPTPPQCWAVHLLRHLELLRIISQGGRSGGSPFPQAMKPDWKGAAQEAINRAQDHAKNLPEFSKKSVIRWWKVAHELFLAMTMGKPWEDKDLEPYSNSSKIDAGAPWKKFDGIRRSNVVRHVRQAFFELASSAE